MSSGLNFKQMGKMGSNFDEREKKQNDNTVMIPEV